MKNIYSILFLLLFTVAARGQSINGGEYFFGTDPGTGNGTPIAISASDTVDFSVTIPATGVLPGFHTLHVRTRNTNGKWSHYASQTFFVQPVQNLLPSPPLAALEYFFDTDPGAGNGFAVAAPVAATQNITVTLPATGLNQGFHTLNFRSKDTDGIWGLYASRSFYIQGTGNTATAFLSESEFFFDTDPGAGNGTPLPITVSDTTSFAFTAASTGLNTGFHTLFIRKRNLDGTWGLFEGRTFYVQGEKQPERSLVEMAWYFDNDSAFATAHRMPLAPTGDLDDLFTFSSDSLPNGEHVLFVRVKDTAGVWSLPRRDTFLVGDCGPITTPSITAIGNDSLRADVQGVSYRWYRNGTLTNLTAKTIKAPASGIYEVEVLTSQSCVSDKSAQFEYWLTGLDDPGAELHAEVFPNPFSSTLNLLAHDRSFTSMKIFDVTGREAGHKLLDLRAGEKETIDMSFLPAGVYTLILSNERQGFQSVFRVIRANQ
ncbi:MAG: T9SS type A sorting domain-containing protein [Bacteroidia bacterium]